MPYLLDANVFIQAKNLHYGFDFCPAFWDWLIAQNESGEVFSIEKVGDELKSGADELAAWAGGLGKKFYLEPDATRFGVFGRVSDWAISHQYEQAAVSTFLQIADYYLVAQALTRSFVVVTHEIPSLSTKKIKIPDACIGLSLKCITPFEMLRSEKARFVLLR